MNRFPLIVVCLLTGFIVGFLTTAESHLAHVHRHDFFDPQDSDYPCQLVQLKRRDGSWSKPHRPQIARRLWRERGRDNPNRMVPLGTTRLYRTKHSSWVIGCLAHNRFKSVSGAKAKSVARCESGFRPWARNGPYLGIFQQGSSIYSNNRPPTSRPYPGGAFNGWSNAFAALNAVTKGGWGPWVCA